MEEFSLKGKKIVLVTHSFSTGPPQELKVFLSDKVKNLLYISHPFSYCKDVRSSTEFYENGVMVRGKFAWPIKGHEIVFYIKDVILTVLSTLMTGIRYDIYIGADNLNAFAGLLLKKMRRVNRVIFYTIDYVPKRFENVLLNKVYHFIDRICCYHCDCVWNISHKIAEGRFANGVSKLKSVPQIVVPNGSNFNEIKRLPIEKINRYYIAFMGHLRKNQGVELVLKAFPEILKHLPFARLKIIGTGPLEADLKELAARLNIANKVDFSGFIEDHSELEEILAKCAIGVAPYVPTPDSFTYFSDPGKPKTYLAAGLPVIITNVPATALEIEKRKAGIVIEYNEEQLIKAVVRLLTDDALYKQYRQNAINYGALFDWDNVFSEAFKNTFNTNALNNASLRTK